MCADGPRPEQAAPSGDAPSPAVPFTTVPAPAHTRFGPVRRFAEIDSTNRYLLDEARAGAPEGAVAVADYQSAGRGRLGRRWEAPPGSNLLMSVLLRPSLTLDELHLCTVAVALAAATACERGAEVVPVLKWPNDLMVGGRKLGGILAEALPAAAAPGEAAAPGGAGGVGAAGGADAAGGEDTAGRDGPAVVVGLGLNVGWPPSGPDAGEEGLLVAATSIRRESATGIEPLDLLGLILEELEGRLTDLADPVGRRRLASEYRRRCDTVGKAVRVSLPGEDFTGTATDITVEGHLIVDVGACLRTVAAGDVVHLRDQG
jgi:BirA family transcriptional regulator, biotin operon repressor / biotin---[acetyl-CoA-carboxylase] ligase